MSFPVTESFILFFTSSQSELICNQSKRDCLLRPKRNKSLCILSLIDSSSLLLANGKSCRRFLCTSLHDFTVHYAEWKMSSRFTWARGSQLNQRRVSGNLRSSSFIGILLLIQHKIDRSRCFNSSEPKSIKMKDSFDNFTYYSGR